jgi:hypothetical protein
MTGPGVNVLCKKAIQYIVETMAELWQKRLPFALLTACLIFASVSSKGFVLVNFDHVHTGEQCSLCMQIEIAQKLLEGPRACLPVFVCGLVLPGPAVRNPSCPSVVPQTLVGLKTKNNS